MKAVVLKGLSVKVRKGANIGGAFRPTMADVDHTLQVTPETDGASITVSGEEVGAQAGGKNRGSKRVRAVIALGPRGGRITKYFVQRRGNKPTRLRPQYLNRQDILNMHKPGAVWAMRMDDGKVALAYRHHGEDAEEMKPTGTTTPKPAALRGRVSIGAPKTPKMLRRVAKSVKFDVAKGVLISSGAS